MKVTTEQLTILQHTIGADKHGQTPRHSERNSFVTDKDGKDWGIIQELVRLGLMRDHGAQAIAGGMHFFTATPKGFDVVASQSPRPPKLTRSQQRYQRYLDVGDCFRSFKDFLNYETQRKKDEACGL